MKYLVCGVMLLSFMVFVPFNNSTFGGIKVNLEKKSNKKTTTRGLFIGVDDYKDKEISKLSGAVSDAEIMYLLTKESLVESSIIINEDATRIRITEELIRLLNNSKENDIFLFYMGSHATRIFNDYYFFPYDTTLVNILGTGVPFRTLNGAFLESAKRGVKIVVILDTCYANGAALDLRDFFISGGSNSGGISYFSSSEVEEKSMERKKDDITHGIFTYYVAKGLSGEADSNSDKAVSIRELYDFIYVHVTTDSNGTQHPGLLGTLSGRTAILVKN